MGQNFSNMCSCLSSEVEKSQEVLVVKDRPIDSLEMSRASHPNEILGFDYKEVLKLYGPAKQKFINIINEGIEGYDTVYDKENCKIYSRDDTEGYVLKYTWNIPYSPEQFISFLSEFELRKKWDTNIEILNIIGSYSDKEYIAYTKFKKFLAFDPRETLAFTKKTKFDGALAEVSVSLQCEDYPVQKNMVRVKLIAAGMHAEAIEDDGTGNITKVTCISHMDVGLPKALNSAARKFAGTSIPPLTKKLVTEMKKFLG